MTVAAITSDSIKAQLSGAVPYIEQDLGVEQIAALYADAIAAAEQRFEREMQCYIDKKVIKMRPAANLTKGEDYDVEEAPLNYVTGSIDRFTLPKWTLRRRPIISVEGVRLAFAEKYPVLIIPEQWWRVNKHLGIISILPIGTQAAIASGMGMWFAPLLDRSWPWKVIPQFVCIDYTAGYEESSTDPDLAEMRWALARCAAGMAMGAARHRIPGSISVDGLSQSFDTVEQRLAWYEEETQKFIREWQKQNRPVRHFVL